MTLANKFSTFRIASIPFFIACFLYYSPDKDFLRFVALGIFLLAVISDAADGYIARVGKQKTKLGSILDPIADKFLLSISFLALYLLKNLPSGVRPPLWIVLTVVSRDIIVILGAAVIFIVKKDLEIIPTKWGKFATFFQMLTVVLILLQYKVMVVFWLAGLLTIVSGLDYLIKGAKTLSAFDHTSNNK